VSISDKQSDGYVVHTGICGLSYPVESETQALLLAGTFQTAIDFHAKRVKGEVRFEGCYEQSTDVVLRAKGDKLLVQCIESQTGEVTQSAEIEPVQIALALECGDGTITLTDEE
jgi:hypothetical protein